MSRLLGPDERALWNRVAASVRPLCGPAASVPEPSPVPDLPRQGRADVGRPASRTAVSRPAAPDTLDSSWDRRLARGLAQPDAIVDLHGHDLDRAWRRVDHALEHALARGDRLLLLITGKPRAEIDRGVIRAAVGNWLAASRHASRIAAVRPAHRRHGGAGALYLVLRKRRMPNG